MEFLSYTQEALDEYLSLSEPDLGSVLMTMADSAEQIVPECVGLSLTLSAPDVTFTLVASALPMAEIDSMQYLAGGPCEAAVQEKVTLETSVAELLDENRWALFAQASSAVGVASSLSLPVLERGRVIGGINLYASTPSAFTGHHADLATALGASATDAVTNADLDFESRRRARRAPQQLRDQQLIDVGVGILAAREDLGIESARETLLAAAVRAGITEVQVAQTLININTA